MPDDKIHCESPMAPHRTTCGIARVTPTYPVAQFIVLCTLPEHDDFHRICFDCLSSLGDIVDLAKEHKLNTGRFSRG